MRILIYRKAKHTAKPSKAKREALAFELAISRIQKPAVREFFESGAFHRLPVIPQHIVKNAPLRIRDHSADGWEVPVDEYGNVNREQEKAAQVIHAWIIRYIVAAEIIERDEFAVVVEP
jgi:hypothetical protein